MMRSEETVRGRPTPEDESARVAERELREALAVLREEARAGVSELRTWGSVAVARAGLKVRRAATAGVLASLGFAALVTGAVASTLYLLSGVARAGEALTETTWAGPLVAGGLGFAGIGVVLWVTRRNADRRLSRRLAARLAEERAALEEAHDGVSGVDGPRTGGARLERVR